MTHYDHPARIMEAEAIRASWESIARSALAENKELRAALHEALERWTELHDDFVAEGKIPNRVQQFRAQFLDNDSKAR